MSYSELKYKKVRIKKDRQCEGCLDTFERGSVLTNRVYMWEGDFHHEYLCEKCRDVLEGAHPQDFEDGWEPGSLRDSWDENILGEWP